ncbi:hypothetical protein HYO62_07235 [Aerococcaceae bacterium DSM 111022]|nr:hypothetical protein [Aerococcaceae bacterium DSM 111022]
MKKIFIILSLIFLSGCSNSITKDYLQSSPWVGDLSPLVEYMEGSSPLSIEIEFHENSVDYYIDSNDFYNVILSQPGNDDFDDNPFSRGMTQSIIGPYLDNSFEYDLDGDNLNIHTNIEGLKTGTVKLIKTSEGFEAEFINAETSEDLIIEFKKK